MLTERRAAIAAWMALDRGLQFAFCSERVKRGGDCSGNTVIPGGFAIP
jgi:hypothetical protein